MSTSYMAKGDPNGATIKIYSTDELLTGGTWIDGKPIYRKVIPFTMPDTYGRLAIDIGVLNLNRETIVNKSVHILHEDNQWISDRCIFQGEPYKHIIVGCEEATDVSEELYINSYTVDLRMGATTPFTPNRQGYVVLEYTKILT